MIKQYIKQPIPTEISEDGGARIVFVNKETVPLDTSIKEAIEGNFITGQESLVKGYFTGTLASMFQGVSRDGHPRTLAGLITLYIGVKGEIDLEKGWDPEKNSLILKARLLKDLKLKTKGWEFQDVTPGKRAFKLATVQAGAVKGVYELGKGGEINGDFLPNTELGEEIRVDWVVEGTDKSGTLDAELVSSNATRINIDAEALEELKSAEYDGKKIIFTVRGNFSNASIEATLKYVAPTEPTLTKVVDAAHEDSPETTWDANAEEGFMFGSGLTTVRELGILKYSEEYPEGEEFTGMIDGSRTDSKLKFELAEPIGSGWTKLVFYAQDLAGHRSEVTLEA